MSAGSANSGGGGRPMTSFRGSGEASTFSGGSTAASVGNNNRSIASLSLVSEAPSNTSSKSRSFPQQPDDMRTSVTRQRDCQSMMAAKGGDRHHAPGNQATASETFTVDGTSSSSLLKPSWRSRRYDEDGSSKAEATAAVGLVVDPQTGSIRKNTNDGRTSSGGRYHQKQNTGIQSVKQSSRYRDAKSGSGSHRITTVGSTTRQRHCGKSSTLIGASSRDATVGAGAEEGREEVTAFANNSNDRSTPAVTSDPLKARFSERPLERGERIRPPQTTTRPGAVSVAPPNFGSDAATSTTSGGGVASSAAAAIIIHEPQAEAIISAHLVVDEDDRDNEELMERRINERVNARLRQLQERNNGAVVTADAVHQEDDEENGGRRRTGAATPGAAAAAPAAPLAESSSSRGRVSPRRILCIGCTIAAVLVAIVSGIAIGVIVVAPGGRSSSVSGLQRQGPAPDDELSTISAGGVLVGNQAGIAAIPAPTPTTTTTTEVPTGTLAPPKNNNPQGADDEDPHGADPPPTPSLPHQLLPQRLGGGGGGGRAQCKRGQYFYTYYEGDVGEGGSFSSMIGRYKMGRSPRPADRSYAKPDCDGLSGLAFDRDGTTAYAQCSHSFAAKNNNELVSVDLKTGATLSEIVELPWQDIRPVMAYNPVDDHLYSIGYDEDALTYNLVKISKTGESVATVGDLLAAGSSFEEQSISAFAINTNGDAFVSADRYLYFISVKDGTHERLAGSVPTAPFVILGFDARNNNGTFYASGMDEPILFTIDYRLGRTPSFTTTTVGASGEGLTGGAFCPL